MMWDWGVPFNMGWFMSIGIIFTILFWGAIIALIVWGIKKVSRGSSSAAKHSPLDLAKERYARGDISREEFEQIKKDLS